jgi:NADPH-dependent 2,4-dienoyl-CoA reductase/sulfur reductase-like enzyme
VSARDPLVVVGGGPAAHAAIAAYREAGGAGRVSLVTDEDALPYERPALSKELLRGETAPDDVGLDDAAWFAQHEVDVHLGVAATAIDPDARTVALADGTTLPYGHCVLATGARPAVPPIDGAAEALAADGTRVHLLRSLAQAVDLRDAAAGAASAIVVGSGFVGCEAAASLARRGLAVRLVSPEDVPHAARLGEDAGRRIAAWLREDGVVLAMDTTVERVDADGRVETSRGPLRADLVLLATGHAPNGGLAEDAGIPTEDGLVVVDAAMRSRTDGVLAAGDVAFAHNAAADRPLRVEHWGEAVAMGETAGRTAAGREAAWAQAPGFWSSIGDRALKQVAWGDGHDDVATVDHGDGAFTAWYGRDGVVVGVLTHGADDDYDRGRGLVESGAAFPPDGA